MYPVQFVNTYHMAMMNQRRCVTIHKHTGGGILVHIYIMLLYK